MLYDPEIATSQLVKADEVVGVDETLFCIGNLSTLTIDNFREKHQCNDFCKMATWNQSHCRLCGEFIVTEDIFIVQ
jgi:hypothetical protein